MGQSLVKNYIHIVFATKYRTPFIQPDVEKELYRFMSGICKELECEAIIIGGYTDHIHVLCNLSKKITLMKLVQELKGISSRWIKSKGSGYNQFRWQDGYGAFSVNTHNLDRLIQYIANQKQHHSKSEFQHEYRLILKKYKMDYDERYVWD